MANSSGGSSFDFSNLISPLTSLTGAGLGIANAQQNYGVLNNALKTIGPTSLQGWGLSGPGGMSMGFNPATDSANINLGSLNPAFSNFGAAAGAGAGAYSPALLQALTGGAAGTLGSALGTLGSAYGNYGAGMGAADAQLGNLGNFGSTYSNLLGAMRGQMAPQVQQSAYGLQNTLFGNGVADSTGAASGSLAEQNFGRGVAQADSTAQLNAFQQALGQQNSAAANYGTLAGTAGGILSSAFNNFGNTNQLVSGLNTAQLNNAATAASGAGALNTVGLNNYNAALQTGAVQGSTRNQSLFPYASVATALSGTPNGMGSLGSFLTQAGGNMSGPGGWSSSPIGQLLSAFGLGGGANGGGAQQVSNFFAQNPNIAADTSSFGSMPSYDLGNLNLGGMSSPSGFNLSQYGSPPAGSSF